MYNKDKFFAKRQILRSGVIFQWKSKLHYWIKSAKKIKYFLNYVCTHYLSTTFEKRQNQFILASMDTQCTSIRITTHSCLHLLGWQSTKYILYFLEKFVRNLTKRIGKQYWHWSILKNKIMAAWRSWCNVNIEQMYYISLSLQHNVCYVFFTGILPPEITAIEILVYPRPFPIT